MLKILLSGACGRMGRQIALLSEDEQAVIAAGVDVKPEQWSDFPVYPSFSLVREEADVIVDFSRPEGLPALLAYAREHRLPLVLAATGYIVGSVYFGRYLRRSRALTIPEFQHKATLTLVSSTSIVEGGAHYVILKETTATLK